MLGHVVGIEREAGISKGEVKRTCLGIDRDPVASILAAFGVLAAGYAARPFGSLIYGHLGDRLGRKPTMILATTISPCVVL